MTCAACYTCQKDTYVATLCTLFMASSWCIVMCNTRKEKAGVDVERKEWHRWSVFPWNLLKA